MEKVIAVEDGLSNVKTALEREGYKVVRPGAGDKMDARIVTGMDDNVMGMQDIKEKSIVLEAAGKTENQLIEELKNRL